MKKEKSCGAVIFKREDDDIKVLLIKNRMGGRWSFPKGHVEYGETERQTALREVFEETGLKIQIIEGFKEQVEYKPNPYIEKKVIYFVGVVDNEQKVVLQEEEIFDSIWCPLNECSNRLTFKNDKALVLKASMLALPHLL